MARVALCRLARGFQATLARLVRECAAARAVTQGSRRCADGSDQQQRRAPAQGVCQRQVRCARRTRRHCRRQRNFCFFFSFLFVAVWAILCDEARGGGHAADCGASACAQHSSVHQVHQAGQKGCVVPRPGSVLRAHCGSLDQRLTRSAAARALCTNIEYKNIAQTTAVGFAIMGFIGFFVKLIHIPVRERGMAVSFLCGN